MKKFILYIFIFLIASFSELIAKNAEKKNCSNQVEILHNKLKQNNLSQDSLKKKFVQTKNIVSDIFDYEKMIRIIYGRNWKKIEINKQNEMKEIFLDYMSYNYTKRFSNIKQLDFKIINNNLIENKILVNSLLIIDSNEKINISYLCNLDSKIEKIFDIIIDGSISEISTKKSEFSKLIKSGGPNGLIEALESKLIFERN